MRNNVRKNRGGAIHATLKTLVRGLGWAVAVSASLLAVLIVGEIARQLLHNTWAAAVVALAVQGLLIGAFAVALRRVVVPNPVWIVLALLVVLNLAATAGMAMFFRLLLTLSPEMGRGFIAGSNSGWTALPVFIRVSSQFVLLMAAVAAWTLSPGGPVFRTKRARMGFVLSMVALALLIAFALWNLLLGAYALASIMGRDESASAGVSVELAHDAGSLRVPDGWVARINTSADPPPKWLPVPPWYNFDAPEIYQNINLTPASQSLETSRALWTQTVLRVYSGDSEWRQRVRERETGGRPYPLPTGVHLGEGAFAYSRTTTSVGPGWRTSVAVFVPNATAPTMIVVTIPHRGPSPPSSTLVADRLRPFWLVAGSPR